MNGRVSFSGVVRFRICVSWAFRDASAAGVARFGADSRKEDLNGAPCRRSSVIPFLNLIQITDAGPVRSSLADALERTIKLLKKKEPGRLVQLIPTKMRRTRQQILERVDGKHVRP